VREFFPQLSLNYFLDHMKKILTVAIALLMPLFSANASLIAVDSPAGPLTAVLDTNTGREWLKLSVTASLTPNQVFAAMEAGGRFEGFHYPGYNELACGLLGANAGLGCPNWVTYDVDPVWALFGTFGLSGKPDGRIYHTLSTFGMDVPELYIFGSAFYYYDEPRPEFDFDSQQVLLNIRRLNEPATHWLVREAQYVPEPSTMVLIGIGAFGLAAQRRRSGSKGLLAKGDFRTGRQCIDRLLRVRFREDPASPRVDPYSLVREEWDSF
jgi:hypothetical protein